MTHRPEAAATEATSQASASLRAQVRAVALWGSGLLVLLVLVGMPLLEPMSLLAGLVVSLASWGFVIWQCDRRRHRNHSPDGSRHFVHLGYGNLVSLLRGWLIAASAGCLPLVMTKSDPSLVYLVAALYTLAALGDGLDGYLARRQQQTTQLGAELDTVLDAFGLVVAPVLAITLGKLHESYLVVSIAYYLFQAGIRWRQYRQRPVYPLPPSRLRRILAGLQMAWVAIALWPPVTANLAQVAGAVVMTPLLIGFCRDWLYVSGRLRRHREGQR
ncbi:MAG: CDP-alcohol phosphatidyltransferase family protein [Saccharospirillum sp.]